MWPFTWISSFFSPLPSQTAEQAELARLSAENRDLRAKLQQESVANAAMAARQAAQLEQTPEARAFVSYDAQIKGIESMLNPILDVIGDDETSNKWKDLFDLLAERLTETLELRRAMLQSSLEFKISVGMLCITWANFLALKLEQIRRDCFKVEGPGFDVSLVLAAQYNFVNAGIETMRLFAHRVNVCAVAEDLEIDQLMQPHVLVLLYERLGVEVPAKILEALSTDKVHDHEYESQPYAASGSPMLNSLAPARQGTPELDQQAEAGSVVSNQSQGKARQRFVSA